MSKALLAVRQAQLGRHPFALVVQHDRRAHRMGAFVADRARRTIDRDALAGAGHQHRRAAAGRAIVVRQSNRAAGIVLQAHDLGGAASAQDLGAEQAFGGRVGQADQAVGVKGDHGVAHPVQYRAEPALLVAQRALDLGLAQRDLDHRAQFASLERLGQVAVRHGAGGAVDGLVVAVGGQEQDRDLQLGADGGGRRDAVHVAPEHHVHQHQVGPVGARPRDGVAAIVDAAADPVTHVAQLAGDVHGDHGFVLDHQQGRRVLRGAGEGLQHTGSWVGGGLFGRRCIGAIMGAMGGRRVPGQGVRSVVEAAPAVGRGMKDEHDAGAVAVLEHELRMQLLAQGGN